MDLPEVENRPPIEISMGQETMPFSFAGATSKIPRGTVIAAFPAVGGPMSMTCGTGRSISLEWGGRLSAAWTSDLGETFFDVMKGAGYNVAGDSSGLFERGQDRARARYKVGARLVDLRGNFCDEFNFWTGMPTNRVMGEMYAKIEREVCSDAERRVVGRFVSEGRNRQNTPAVEGAAQALIAAFGMATGNLAADPAFLALLRGDAPPDGAKAGDVADKGVGIGPSLSIAGPPPSTWRLTDRIDTVLDGVVTIRLSDGHGSGFFIGYRGYGLTNAHVVGAARTVMVRLRSGMEVEAEVLRVSKSRDVALFKAPVQILKPLSLAPNALPARLDEVYAVGTPLKLGMQATVTKGVVNALRRAEEGGRPITYIQSDAAFSPGNSGGPLLNGKGNVVGIAVSILAVDGVQVGLNRFIPINAALDALRLKIEATRRP